MPRVWPVIATRSRPQWLVRQLEALLPQLAEREKIVVVVDTCPETAASLDKVDRAKVQVVCLTGGPIGPDLARRIGNSQVPSSACVCEIDDHDTAGPDLLAELRGAFADPDVLMAFCDVLHADPERKVQRVRVKDDSSFATRGFLAFGLKSYRKWVYDAVGGYPLEWWPVNDYAMCCKIEQFGGRGCYRHIRKVLLTVTEDSQGISRQNEELQKKRMAEVSEIALRQGFRLPFGLVAEKEADGLTASTGAPRGRVRVNWPRPLHFVWIGSEMPVWAKENVGMFRALNPGFTVMVHGEEVLLERYRKGYEALAGQHLMERRADLLRLSALLKFGGAYGDVDFVPFRPVSDIALDHDLSRGFFAPLRDGHVVANGFMWCDLNSTFLARYDAEVSRMCAQGQGFNTKWGAYGPDLLTRMVEEGAQDIELGRPEMFFPSDGRMARKSYLRLAEHAFAPEFVRQEFPGLGQLPYMMHMEAQGSLTVNAELETANV